MRRSGPGLAALAWCCLLLPAATAAWGAEHSLAALLDGRVLTSDANDVWFDRGLDKQRFSTEDAPVALGQALLQYRGDWLPSLSTLVSAAFYGGRNDSPHVTEAFVELHPVPRSAWRIRGRAGLFYPPLSLENTAIGWTSPYTLSFSAVNTWIAEEIRAEGAELELTHMGRFESSASDFGFTGGAFRGNDPAGALVSWRGFALHERQTGLFERLPLADLPGFSPRGSLYPQQAYEKPFVEIDGRTGYYLGARWDYLGRSRLQAMHYDNLGDPTKVKDGQWAWRTRFDHLGGQLHLAPGIDLLAQQLRGDTEMYGAQEPLVNAKFWAAYVLVSRAWGAHRLSVRADGFGVADEDATAGDPNQEHGHAWTVAYFYSLPGGGAPLGGSWRLGLEVLSVSSDRPARRLLGSASGRRETSAQLSAQLRF